MSNQGSVPFSFFTLTLVILLPKSDSAPIESLPMLRNHSPADPQTPQWRRCSNHWVWTQQDKPYLAFPCLHCQHQVILELFLAVLTCAVEVILLLQLLLPLLAQAEEIHVGNSQLIPWGNLVQGSQLYPEGRGDGMCTWRSSRSRSAATELSGMNLQPALPCRGEPLPQGSALSLWGDNEEVNCSLVD